MTEHDLLVTGQVVKGGVFMVEIGPFNVGVISIIYLKSSE